MLRQLSGRKITESQRGADLKDLKNDYRGVISLLDVNATKLALAMKPPVTWEAVKVLIKDLEKQVSSQYLPLASLMVVSSDEQPHILHCLL